MNKKVKNVKNIETVHTHTHTSNLRKENILRIIIGFIVGAIIASSITVYAVVNASQVNYQNNKTVEQALNELYSLNLQNKITNINNNNVVVEYNQCVDGQVSKSYTASEEEILVLYLCETGESGWYNNYSTTGSIIYDSNNQTIYGWSGIMGGNWYSNMRTILIKLEEDDTVTVETYGFNWGSAHYSMVHIK